MSTSLPESTQSATRGVSRPWAWVALGSALVLSYLGITVCSSGYALFGRAGYADFLCGLDTPSTESCLPGDRIFPIKGQDVRLVTRIGSVHHQWHGGGCWDDETKNGPISLEIEGYGRVSMERQGQSLVVNGQAVQPGESWQASGPKTWSLLDPWIMGSQQLTVRNNGVFDCYAMDDEPSVPLDVLYITGVSETEGTRLTPFWLALGVIALALFAISIVKIRKNARDRAGARPES